MATLALVLPVALCVATGLLAAVARATGFWRWVGVISSVGILGCALLLSAAVLAGQHPTALGGLLAADALSAFMLVVIGCVGLVASWAGFGAGRDWTYGSLVGLFLGAMSLAVLTDNLGVLLVAIEATTVATAFLVGHEGSRRSLEAAWKYVILGSAGIALAFLGVVLLYTATLAAEQPTLSWAALASGQVTGLDPSLMRLAGGLMVLGFATKVGLAPMHSWLPDAHSQAPAPVSGLMSGVLLSVAFYAILRVQAVVDEVVGPQFLRGILIAAGLASLAVAGLLLIRQRDLKRMLAYSSVEHMGIVALAAAIGGPVAITAALLHVLGHGLVKSSLFVVSGRILVAEGTASIPAIRRLASRRPDLASPLIVGLVALLGLPPFSLFFTEVAIAFAGVEAGLGWVVAVAVLLLLVVFAAIVRLGAHMTLGVTDPRVEPETSDGRQARAGFGRQLPIVAAFGAAIVVGFAVGPLPALLDAAGQLLTVRR
ncbi:MAG TPA: proton-conducting transporter membrane subunit [Actinomycetota bacterium]|nr:proton-conducting transporter membrane subunit [Actinomycetota bacterium]